MTDLDIYLMKSEIAYLRKRIEELESGEVYSGLIKEISLMRVELDALREDSVRLADIRRMLDV